LVARISIWDPAMSGWPVIQSGWSVFMDGKDTMLIGETTPFAMIVSELMLTGMFSQWGTAGQKTQRPRRSRRKTNNIDRARFRFCLASRCLELGGTAVWEGGRQARPPCVIVGEAAEFLHEFSSNLMLQIAGEGLTITNCAGRRCFRNQRKPTSDEEKPSVSKAGGCKENQKRRL
jgi:hypothetical protein